MEKKICLITLGVILIFMLLPVVNVTAENESPINSTTRAEAGYALFSQRKIEIEARINILELKLTMLLEEKITVKNEKRREQIQNEIEEIEYELWELRKELAEIEKSDNETDETSPPKFAGIG